jgi:enamine deaminase RidA (YjgF/YER057c/UK114 family)
MPPFDPDTGELLQHAPFERQAERILEQMKTALEAAGSDLDHVLKCNVLCISESRQFCLSAAEAGQSAAEWADRMHFGFSISAGVRYSRLRISALVTRRGVVGSTCRFSLHGSTSFILW